MLIFADRLKFFDVICLEMLLKYLSMRTKDNTYYNNSPKA